MEELYNALKIRQKYNAMDFDDFIKIFEKDTNQIVPSEIKEDYKYTGLNNVDFGIIGFESSDKLKTLNEIYK